MMASKGSRLMILLPKGSKGYLWLHFFLSLGHSKEEKNKKKEPKEITILLMYIVHGIVRSDIYLLCKFIPQCAVVTCSHTSSKIRRCRANAASAVVVQQKYLRYIY